MKGHLVLICVVATVVLSGCSSTEETVEKQNNEETMKENSNQWIVDDLIIKWENNKKYTLEMIELMPEEAMDEIPAEGMESYRWQVEHFSKSFVNQSGKIPDFPIAEIDVTTKESMLKSMEEVFDSILKYLNQINGSKLSETMEMWYGTSTRLRVFNLMDNHLAHHRGQMIVYLRLKGIKPAKYVGW